MTYINPDLRRGKVNYWNSLVIDVLISVLSVQASVPFINIITYAGGQGEALKQLIEKLYAFSTDIPPLKVNYWNSFREAAKKVIFFSGLATKRANKKTTFLRLPLCLLINIYSLSHYGIVYANIHKQIHTDRRIELLKQHCLF